MSAKKNPSLTRYHQPDDHDQESHGNWADGKRPDINYKTLPIPPGWADTRKSTGDDISIERKMLRGGIELDPRDKSPLGNMKPARWSAVVRSVDAELEPKEKTVFIGFLTKFDGVANNRAWEYRSNDWRDITSKAQDAWRTIALKDLG